MSELRIKSLAVLVAALVSIFVNWFTLEIVGETNKFIATTLALMYLFVSYYKLKKILIDKYGVKK